MLLSPPLQPTLIIGIQVGPYCCQFCACCDCIMYTNPTYPVSVDVFTFVLTNLTNPLLCIPTLTRPSVLCACQCHCIIMLPWLPNTDNIASPTGIISAVNVGVNHANCHLQPQPQGCQKSRQSCTFRLQCLAILMKLYQYQLS